MDKRKLGRYLFFVIGLVMLFFIFKRYSIRDVFNTIVGFNLKVSQEKFVCTFFLYLVEIVVLSGFWDSLIWTLYWNIKQSLHRISGYLLKKEKIEIAVLCIRLAYGARKLTFYLFFGWCRTGISYGNKVVWTSIKRPPIREVILGLASSFVKLPALLALFLTLISLKWFELMDLQHKWIGSYEFNFNFWEIAKLISPLTAVVLLVFLGYFVSFKGGMKRAIAQANYKKMEDIIQQQRGLLEAMHKAIYLIAENLEYVINCQDLVVDLTIYGQYPDYENKKYRSIRKYNVDGYCFKDIPELEIMSEKFKILNSFDNRTSFRSFCSHKYEFFILINEGRLEDVQRLNKIFFTKDGMKDLIANIKPGYEDLSQRFDELQKQYTDELSEKLVNSLDLLYKLYRYYDEMCKLLNFRSDKLGRMVRILTGKE